jgi:hypothetical protein
MLRSRLLSHNRRRHALRRVRGQWGLTTASSLAVAICLRACPPQLTGSLGVAQGFAPGESSRIPPTRQLKGGNKVFRLRAYYNAFHMHEQFRPERQSVFRPVHPEIQPKIYVGKILPPLKRGLPEGLQIQLLLFELNDLRTQHADPLAIILEPEEEEKPDDPVKDIWERLARLLLTPPRYFVKTDRCSTDYGNRNRNTLLIYTNQRKHQTYPTINRPFLSSPKTTFRKKCRAQNFGSIFSARAVIKSGIITTLPRSHHSCIHKRFLLIATTQPRLPLPRR